MHCEQAKYAPHCIRGSRIYRDKPRRSQGKTAAGSPQAEWARSSILMACSSKKVKKHDYS